jgi:hypothetical protein
VAKHGITPSESDSKWLGQSNGTDSNTSSVASNRSIVSSLVASHQSGAIELVAGILDGEFDENEVIVAVFHFLTTTDVVLQAALK